MRHVSGGREALRADASGACGPGVDLEPRAGPRRRRGERGAHAGRGDRRPGGPLREARGPRLRAAGRRLLRGRPRHEEPPQGPRLVPEGLRPRRRPRVRGPRDDGDGGGRRRQGPAPRAARRSRAGCDVAPATCTVLGAAWADGLGGPKDLAKARAFYEKACTWDDRGRMRRARRPAERWPGRAARPIQGAGALRQGVLAWSRQGLRSAGLRAPLRRGRTRQPPSSTSAVGQVVRGRVARGVRRAGRDVPGRQRRAQGLRQGVHLVPKACDGGLPAGCLWIADLEAGRQSWRAAREFRRKACDLGDTEGCHLLAVAWRDGLGGDKDAAKARALLAKVCDADHAAGCQLLATMLRAGEGGSRDLAQARKLFAKACAAGATAACKEKAR